MAAAVTVAVPAVVYVEVPEAGVAAVDLDFHIRAAVSQISYNVDGVSVTVDDFDAKHAEVLDGEVV